jgi:hypothetical protein
MRFVLQQEGLHYHSYLFIDRSFAHMLGRFPQQVSDLDDIWRCSSRVP